MAPLRWTKGGNESFWLRLRSLVMAIKKSAKQIYNRGEGSSIRWRSLEGTISAPLLSAGFISGIANRMHVHNQFCKR